MAKVKEGKEFNMGEVGMHQLQGPQTFQLEEHGTPEHLCDMLPSYDGEPMEPEKTPRDPAGFVPCSLFGEGKKGKH